MKTVIKSFRGIHWRLFFALLLMGLCPTVYTTVRVFFLGQLPGEWSYSIAGQLSWVNLIYEITDEAIILPLFFFVGKVVEDKKEFVNRLKTGLLASLGIYIVLAALVTIFAEPLLKMMAASPDIIAESASYIRIESVANVFGILFRFVCVALVAIGRDKPVYILTGAKFVLCLISDAFLVSSLPFSAKLGVNGIGISNVIVNAFLLIVVLVALARLGYGIFDKGKISFAWMKDFVKIGGISGAESLVRNIAYMLMVSRMVNMVGEQGTYWVTNNFIWGWLLLPILQLGELIKQETSTDENAVRNNSVGYFTITGEVCLLWVVFIPLYKPFMRYILNFDDVDKLFHLVMVLLGFYVLFAVQNVFDATFYGRGKTDYMLLESVVTNSVYYGTFFVLYLTGVWEPTLIGIALMFGIGNAFDSVVSGAVYAHYLKKNKINILSVGSSDVGKTD